MANYNFIIIFSALILCVLLIKKKDYKKIPKNLIYAGFWVRFIAYLIDFIILTVISVILAFIPIIGWIISIFLPWLYFAILQSSSKQATIGMRVLDIKIVDETHKKIGFWRATGNYFVLGISIFILFVGVIMIAFTKRKQGLHNIISRTLLLKVK